MHIINASSTLLLSSKILSSPFCRWEFKLNHEEWLTTAKPALGSATAARAKAALDTSSHLVPLLQRIKDEARYAINDLLKVIFSYRSRYKTLTTQVYRGKLVCMSSS